MARFICQATDQLYCDRNPVNNTLIFCAFLIHTHTDPPSVLSSENPVEQIIIFYNKKIRLHKILLICL